MAQASRSDLGFIRNVFMRLRIYVEIEANIPNGVARRKALRSLLLRRSVSPVFPWCQAVILLTGGAFPLVAGGASARLAGAGRYGRP